jgi:hypothetical protein
METLMQELIDPISFKIMANPHITKCGHTFDLLTLSQLFEKSDDKNKSILCPICKQIVLIGSFVKNIVLKNIIEKVREINSLKLQLNEKEEKN